MSLIPGIPEILRRFDLFTDARPIAYVRVIIGVACLLRAQEAWSILSQVLISPLRFPYLPGVPDLPTGALPLLIGLWAAAAAAFAAGWKTRLAGSLLTAVMAYVLVLDQQSYSNHLYLLCLITLLLTIADAGATFSLDARQTGNRPTVPAWPVTLLRCQLSLVYGLGAIAKLAAPSYLDGSVISANLHPGLLLYLSGLSADVQGTIFLLFGLAGAVVELFLTVGFWIPRFRRLSVLLGLGLHAFMVFGFCPAVGVQIQVFAIATTSLYLLFFPFPAPKPAKS